MPRPIQLALVAGIVLVGLGVAGLLKKVRLVLTNTEVLMADFDVLHGDMDSLRSEVAAAAERVEAALDRVLDDSADQSEVDAASAEIREITASLKAIAPDTTPAPSPEPTPEPAPEPGPEGPGA